MFSQLQQRQVQSNQENSDTSSAAAGGPIMNISDRRESLNVKPISGFGQLRGFSSSAIAKRAQQNPANSSASVQVEDGLGKKVAELINAVKTLADAQKQYEKDLSAKDELIAKVEKEAADARSALIEKIAEDRKKSAEFQAAEISAIKSKLEAEERQIAKVEKEALEARTVLAHKVEQEQKHIADKLRDERQKAIDQVMKTDAEARNVLSLKIAQDQQSAVSHLKEELQEKMDSRISDLHSVVGVEVEQKIDEIDKRNQNNTVENFLMLMHELDEVVADNHAVDESMKEALLANLEQETLKKGLRLAHDKGADVAKQSIFSLIMQTNPGAEFASADDLLKFLDSDQSQVLIGDNREDSSDSDLG